MIFVTFNSVTHLTNIEKNMSNMKIFNIVCWLNNIERQTLKKVKKSAPT
ncbi:hypothetical protein A464_63 [Salmonella bongori N268-08]|uniref:Uncharacterized protein n=1 Tax=Salmonella bongori N268-08 TaxID=1197719 RepID=S5MRL2_SALBN|nr:hypothetical protein A464_63 [Salmonella bongori N268-08]